MTDLQKDGYKTCRLLFYWVFVSCHLGRFQFAAFLKSRSKIPLREQNIFQNPNISKTWPKLPPQARNFFQEKIPKIQEKSKKNPRKIQENSQKIPRKFPENSQKFPEISKNPVSHGVTPVFLVNSTTID